MAFWEDLSDGVKRYIIIGVVLLVGLLAFRKCVTAPVEEPGGKPPQRGIVR